MAINPNDPASGINVRTCLAAAALNGHLASGKTFSAAEVVKAADSVIAELNKGAISSATGPIGAASSTGNQTLNVGTPGGIVRR